MGIQLNVNDSAIVRGIKTVGVGKKGSQSLDSQLARDILADLQSGLVPPAAMGAFFAGLFLKGIDAQESVLDQYFNQKNTLFNAAQLVNALGADAPEWVREMCVRILEKETLTRDQAFDLGNFLMSKEPGDALRGLVASALRVRYETDDEYEGLLKAIEQTISPEFLTPVPSGKSIVQLAEPFDGSDHSYMITPLLGRFIQSLGYRVMHLVGRNSGPKLVFNLLDVAEGLNAAFLKNNSQLSEPSPELGWFIHQKDLSALLDRWVDIRRQTIKRPFLATLEKFVNPVKAQIIATSAFHPPYGEKMLTISERAGFPGIIVIRNGIEGSLAFPLKREARILCSARQKNGSYERHEIIIDPEKFLSIPFIFEEKLEHPDPQENVRLINAFISAGKTDNMHFDARVKITCEGFRLALDWIVRQGIII